MITACPTCCCIPLTQGRFALVDPEDWVALERKNWRAKKSRGGWYAYKITRVNGRNRYTYMHRLINKPGPGEITHHKNGFTLDNRRANLQDMTEAEHDNLHRILRIAKRSLKKTG